MRTNYQALIDVAEAATGPNSVDSIPLATVRAAIDALRSAALFAVETEDFSPQAERYWLLTLSALEQSRIWADMAQDVSK